MNMIEKVAIAIWEKASSLKPGPWNDALNLWERADSRDKFLARRQAKIAIEAMRDPTNSMIYAGYGRLEAHKQGASKEYSSVENVYRNMIDVALKEE